jgi:hypothetical protein
MIILKWIIKLSLMQQDLEADGRNIKMVLKILVPANLKQCDIVNSV